MQCPGCHAEIAANASVCPQCNTPLQSELQIFYAMKKQTFGPISPAQLRGMIEYGQIPKQTMIYHNGLPGWIPAFQLFGDMQTGAPADKQAGQRRISMILGYIGIGAWIIPIAGIVTGIIGVVFGTKGGTKKGIILNALVLAFSVMVLIASIAGSGSSYSGNSHSGSSYSSRASDDYLANKYNLTTDQVRALRGEGYDSSSSTSAILNLVNSNYNGYSSSSFERDFYGN